MAPAVTVETVEDGALLSIVIDNPRGNILTSSVMTELDQALAAHADDADLKLVTIGAAGRHFSFGDSVEEHRAETAPAMLATFHRLIRSLATYPVPTAAVVSGRCLGGAFELALACTFVIASDDAIFACPEIQLGVFPPVLAALGPARLGPLAAERLLLTGGEIDAASARHLGFVTAVTPAGTDLREATLDWFRSKLAPLSAFALRQGLAAVRGGAGTARLVEDGLADAERRYVDELLPAHDPNEGIDAFLAKRPPAWRNR